MEVNYHLAAMYVTLASLFFKVGVLSDLSDVILRINVTVLYLALGGLFDKGFEHREVFTNSFLFFPRCLA